LSVVLHSLAEYFNWIETKIYRVDDLDYLIKEVEPRVKQSLAHLVNGGFFSQGDFYTILATFLDYIDTIAGSYEKLRQRYAWTTDIGPMFRGVVTKYEKVVKERHAIAPVEPVIAKDEDDNTTPDSSDSELNELINGGTVDFPTSSMHQHLVVGSKRKRTNA
jgi:hypothetical protein